MNRLKVFLVPSGFSQFWNVNDLTPLRLGSAGDYQIWEPISNVDEEPEDLSDSDSVCDSSGSELGGRRIVDLILYLINHAPLKHIRDIVKGELIGDLSGKDLLAVPYGKPVRPWCLDLLEEINRIRWRISKLNSGNRRMKENMDNLARQYQKLERRTSNVQIKCQTLKKDLQDVQYLEELINLLNCETELINYRNWPFRKFNSATEINLLI